MRGLECVPGTGAHGAHLRSDAEALDEVRPDLHEPLFLKVLGRDDRDGMASSAQLRLDRREREPGLAGARDGLHNASVVVRGPTIECADLPRIQVERARPASRRRAWWFRERGRTPRPIGAPIPERR